ncbi:MAG: acetylornithine deacetylase [marine bacterium B5-7]|nr:MAG: acetylornithine deacetylase [marine bacterium B5-7]
MTNEASTTGDEIAVTPRQETIELLEKLIGFDTTSSKPNIEMIDFIRDHLQSIGASCITTPSSDGRKANLLATIGPLNKPGIMLSGHSDVVPVEGQQWHSNPFILTENNGRYYGRGSCDMKGFLAVVIEAAEKFANARLTEPLHIAITYDEEIGCLGVPHLIDAMRSMSIKPRLAIVGEPTDMRVAIGHKGARAYRACFTGRESHSSLAPLTVNAIENAADFVTRLTAMGRRFANQGPFDEDYDVAYTTVNTGVFHGGTQVNIVPSHCEVEFEYRALPQQDNDAPEKLIRQWLDNDISPSMKSVDEQCGVELERRYAYPGLDTDPHAEVTQLATELSEASQPIKIAFGTEAGCYHQYLDCPSVVCGPGSIRQAHRADEYVSELQLAKCEQFVERLRHKMSES